MPSRSYAAIGITLILTSACGSHSPTSPTAPGNSRGLASPRVLQGHTASAADAVALAGVSVQLGTRFPAMSDTNGYFSVENDLAGDSAIELTGPSIVQRQTAVRLPADGLVTFGLIPATFDLVAFDEMFRGSHERLQRWTTVPSLVVLTSVMRFDGAEASVAEATAEQIAPDEVDSLVRDLTQALAVLTGNTYPAFARVTLEASAPGTRASTARSGQIVVGRYRDLKALNKAVGYGRCAEREDGTITGGSVFLDAGFDGTNERRRLLRTHELGHALGYKHVTSRLSIMNPAIGSDVTDFDRQGATIAFQRPPGNRSPDTDPPPGIRPAAAGGVRWIAPIP